MTVMQRLLWNRQGRWPLVLAALGFTLGLFLLFTAVRFSGDVIAVLKSQGGGSRFVVIHKQVDIKDTLALRQVAFTDDELKELEQQPFIQDMGSIVTTNFAVMGYAALGLSMMQSDLFFEAVDDRFLDEIPDDWHWQEGDMQIPAIMARDFLVLYNFGYAAAKGMPQLTEESIGILQANVVCSGTKTQSFVGRIVGFSDRFSTILVPMSFITWANTQIGGKEPPPVSRVVLEIESGQGEALQAFMKSKGYSTNQEKLPITQVAKTLQVVLLIVSVFGGVLMLVSVLSLVLLLQLLMTRSQQELQLLHQLGYDDRTLTRTYVRVILPVLISCFTIAGAGVWGIGFALQQIVAKLGVTISPHPNTLTLVLFGGAFIGILVLFCQLIVRVVQRIG